MTNDYFVNETLRLLGFYCSCDAPKSPKGDKLREHPNCANVSYKQGSRGAGEQGSRGAGEQGSRGENRFKFSYIPVHQNIFAKTGCTLSFYFKSSKPFSLSFGLKRISVCTPRNFSSSKICASTRRATCFNSLICINPSLLS